jgi:hypothetical protein
MVLLDDVVQILDRSVAAPVAEYPFLFYVCDGRVVDRRQYASAKTAQALIPIAHRAKQHSNLGRPELAETNLGAPRILRCIARLPKRHNETENRRPTLWAVSASSILPKWFLNQWLTDPLFAHAHFYFL